MGDESLFNILVPRMWLTSLKVKNKGCFKKASKEDCLRKLSTQLKKDDEKTWGKRDAGS